MTINIRYFTQLFLSYILLLMVAIGGLSLLTVSFVKQYVENQTIEHLSRQLTHMDYMMGMSDDLQTILNSLNANQSYHFRLTVISTDGKVLFDSEKKQQLLDNHSDRPEVKLAMKEGLGSAIRYSKTIEKTLVYVAKMSMSGHIHRLALPIHYLQDEWDRICQKIVIYTLAIFGFCLLLTFLMSHWISSPLNWAIQTLQQIKSGSFERIAPRASFVREINNVNRLLVEVSDNISQFIGKLSREKEKKDIILNNMINGLIVIDRELSIRVVNKAAFSLFFNLANTNEIIDLKTAPHIYSFASSLMAGQSVGPIEIEHVNGKTVLVSGSIYTEAEEPRGILTAQDITQLKRLESTRQQFVANVSHELKTPITIIRSMVETLLTSKNKNIEISLDFLKKGLGHTDRLTQIIDDLLQLSTLETTGEEIKKGNENLQVIIDNAVQQCSENANQKFMTIVSDNNQKSITCNANLLGQAIKNLVENAIKYSQNSTCITIKSTKENGQINIHVIDQGVGIEEQHIGKLFQRFYRVDAARSRQMGGTGLGLAIVKHIAQAHGGQASVKSIPGQGTTFTISIPN